MINEYYRIIQCSLLIFSFIQAKCMVLKKDPEVSMNISEMIRYNGYPCEDYSVITQDGYILSMQRIPYGRNGVKVKNSRPVVLLQHGLLDSAVTWVINYPYQSLGFLLADNGYDVWLSNSRGSTYSNKHVNLTDKDAKFWEFSWDEMSRYDLPAFVNFALKTNGNASKLTYIGHSQGTLIAFARLPQDAWLRQHISSFVAFGPVAYLSHVEAGLKIIARFKKEIEMLLHLFGHGQFLPNNEIFRFLASTLCSEIGIPKLCSDIIFLIIGNDFNNLNQSRLPVYISHTPAGTSVMNVVHYAQEVSSGNFEMYDFGTMGNIKHYGTPTPPQYIVKPSGIPTALFSGGKDTLADPTDVDKLVPLLSTDVKINKRIDYYNHLDFVWGEDAHKVIYEDVLTFIKQYS